MIKFLAGGAFHYGDTLLTANCVGPPNTYASSISALWFSMVLYSTLIRSWLRRLASKEFYYSFLPSKSAVPLPFRFFMKKRGPLPAHFW